MIKETKPGFPKIYMKLTTYNGTTMEHMKISKNGWYFRFDDDNKMSYEYFLSIF